jgi:hypothetical protein
MPSKIPVEISFTGIANFLGVVGVIGSLIFVGLELRQTQQIALAAQVQSRAEQLTDRSLVWLQGEWELSYRIRTLPHEAPTPAEIWAKELETSWQKPMQQTNYYAYRAGLLDEDQWKVISNRILEAWNKCELRHTYDFQYLEDAYVDYLRSLPDECSP